MLFRGSVVTDDGEKVSPYLLCEPRTLRSVCRTKGGDEGGRRCPSCSVREFCEAQAVRAACAD